MDLSDQVNTPMDQQAEPSETFETLCYKHITLSLLRNSESVREMLAMEVDLCFTKGHKRNYKRYASLAALKDFAD